MKRALITLDYYPNALKGAEMGFLIAKSMGVNLTLIHISVNPLHCDEINRVANKGFGFKLESHSEISKYRFEFNALMHEFFQKSKLNIGDDYVLTFIKESESVESVLKAAKKIKADLIYIINMGSQNRRLSQYRSVNKVTENGLFKTILPVLVIPVIKNIR